MTTEHIAEENWFIMFDPNQMDVVARKFWEMSQMVIICSRDAMEGIFVDAGEGYDAHAKECDDAHDAEGDGPHIGNL